MRDYISKIQATYPSRLVIEDIRNQAINGYGQANEYRMSLNVHCKGCNQCKIDSITYNYISEITDKKCHHQWSIVSIEIASSTGKTYQKTRDRLNKQIKDWIKTINDNKLKAKLL